MSKTEAEEKFDRYCAQLEKYGRSENVHSPNMSLLRRKARKQLIELMKEPNDVSHKVNKLWNIGYYRPFQYFAQNTDESVMETATLLTLFCGELHELLEITDKYSALLNLFLGDLHRYFPDDAIQKSLSEAFYGRSILQDPRIGRAYYALSLVKNGGNLKSLAEKLRLLLVAQLSDRSYDTVQKIEDLITIKDAATDNPVEVFLKEFIAWSLFHNSSKSEHDKKGAELVGNFKKIENLPEDCALSLSVLKLASQLALQKFGFARFMECFDVVSEVYSNLYSRNAMSEISLLEATSWVLLVSETFEKQEDSQLSNFLKTKWSNLNDVICEHLISSMFTETQFSLSDYLLNGPKVASPGMLHHLILQIGALKNPTMILRDGKLIRRSQASPKHHFQPISIEELENLKIKEIGMESREDWKPIYVIMEAEIILKNLNYARKIWQTSDFISILPSCVLAELDNRKTTNPREVRPALRALEDAQSSGDISMRNCEDIKHLAKALVDKIDSTQHSKIVGILCEHPEEHDALEGVTFYKISEFWKMCLE